MAVEVDGVKSFEYVEMDCPNPRAAQAGRLNKSASEVWKSTVQMNSVNLPGGALYSCWDDVLWNLVCYPLLPLALEPTPSNSPPPCVLALTLSPFPVYIPFLSSSSSLSTALSVSVHLSPSSPLVSLQLRVYGARNETGTVSAGGCWYCWYLPSFLQQSPPCSHLLLPAVSHNFHSALKC